MNSELKHDFFITEYRFSANLWKYSGGAGSWYFIALPKEESANIKSYFPRKRKGWGAIPVIAEIGKTIWKTSIFPYSKSGSYLLPVKADVRKKEEIDDGNVIDVTIKIGV